MDHAPITESHVLEVLCAGLTVRFEEDYIDPGSVQISEFNVAEVKASTIIVSVSLDLHIQDGFSGLAHIELDRWDPTRGRFVSFDS